MQEISCSAERPPKRMTNRTRSGRSAIRGNVPAVRVRAGDVAAATEGRLVGDDVEVDGVSIDSRGVVPGNLCVPLVAARDGDDFVADAVAAGAVAHLPERQPSAGT